MKKILIGCDHAAYDLVDQIIAKYPQIEFINCNQSDQSVDYSDVALNLVQNISSDIDYLICICGTGFGITNAVLKQTQKNGLILKNKKQIKTINQQNLFVIGFGARTTNKELIFDFLNQI